MKAVKFAAGLACGLTVLLLILAFTVKNPEVALYEDTVEKLRQATGIPAEQSMEEQFPALAEIQADLKRIAELNQYVNSQSRCPAPDMSREEMQKRELQLEQIQRLRTTVRLKLSQLLAANSRDQP